jgi:hypothetical protein
MKVLKKSMQVMAAVLLMSSLIVPAQAESAKDKPSKAPVSKIVRPELTGNSFSSGASFATASYDLDDIIEYPTSNDNVASSLSFTNDTSRKLYVSNSPEYFSEQGILGYSTQINQTGKFRVYWAHKNYNQGTNYVGFALFNNTGKTINVMLEKRAHYEAADGGLLGQKLLADYLKSSSAKYKYATLTNGSYTYIGFPVQREHYGTGMYDVRIEDTSGNLVTGGITVKTYATYNGTGNPSQVLSENKVLPGDGNQIRGLFPAARKTLTWYAYAGEQISFSPALAHIQGYTPWEIPSNDIMWGTDEASGNIQVFNQGNYGVIYDLDIRPQEDVSIVFAPNLPTDQGTSRSQHYLALDADTRGVLTNTVSEGDGWVVLQGSDGDSLDLETSLPGYHWAPLRIAAIANDSGSGTITESYYLTNDEYPGYSNNIHEEHTITVPGASQIRVHFAEIDVESGWDFVLTSADDMWSGSYTDQWSSWVSGDSITVALDTDGSVTYDGFVIDKIEYVP